MSQGDTVPILDTLLCGQVRGWSCEPSDQRGGVLPSVGWLLGLEGDAILVWCDTAGLRGLAQAQGWIPWLQRDSLPF